jgi:hypothetical protein
MGCDVVHAAQVGHQLMARLASMGTCVLRIPRRNEERIKLSDIVHAIYRYLPAPQDEAQALLPLGLLFLC